MYKPSTILVEATVNGFRPLDPTNINREVARWAVRAAASHDGSPVQGRWLERALEEMNSTPALTPEVLISKDAQGLSVFDGMALPFLLVVL